MSRMHTCAASLCLGVALAITFPPLGCGGSGGRVAQGDAEVPGSVAWQLRSCAAEHTHLKGEGHSISFDVKLAHDGNVDGVALRASTLADEGLEACMAGALRSLSLGDLPLRRADLDRRGPVSSESRALLGQEEVLAGCLASPPCLLTLTVLVGATYIAVKLYVYAMSHSIGDTLTIDECIAKYVDCKEWTPKAPCKDCLGQCRVYKRWDRDRCP